MGLMVIDKNECNTNNGGCSHSCVNTEGSFTCECQSGLVLQDDGLTCEGMYACMYT